MKFKSLFCAVAAASVISIASADTLNVTSLTSDQLTAFLKGNTVTFGPSAILNDKYVTDTIKVYFDASGSMTGKWKKALPNTPEADKGTWAVTNDQLCITWEKWGKNCVSFYPLDKSYLLIDENKKAILIAKDSSTSGDHVSK